jgi:hypothetical protein
MGLIKISDLPSLTTGNVSNNDFIPVVDIPPSGTTRTKKMLLQDLFTIAPVKSVNGLTTGDVSLASTHLTDASNIGRILNINGFSSGNVSLGSSDLTNGSDIAHHSDLGSVQGFTNEYNNPTTAQLQTEYEELARLLGTDQNNLRVSLFAVQQTADDAMPTTTANSTFATKVSLGEFTKSLDIIANHYTKTETDAKYATQVSLSNYTTSSDIINAHYTKSEVDNLFTNNPGSQSANFTINHLVANSASIATLTKTGQLQTSGNANVGNDLVVANDLSSLRADIGDGTSSAVGTSSTLFVHGNAYVKGTLVADQLEILGSTKIKNTQVVEVSDDFILLNKDNQTTSGGGVQVYQASSSDLASLEWDEVNQIWNFKVGGQLADIGANNLGSGSTGNVTNIPTTTSIYSLPKVSIDALGNQITFRDQISLGMSVNEFPVEQTCCSLSYGGLTDLKNLRAQVLRNVNTICTGINMFNIEKGFEFSQTTFAGSLNPPPQLPTGAFTAPTTSITTTITPTGTGSTSTQVSLGNRSLQGAYITFYLDTSGSMNYFLPTANQSLADMRSYLQTLYYDNSTEANQFIPVGKERSNERWMDWMSDVNGDQQLNIAIINESRTIYHNDNYLESADFVTDFGKLQTSYNSNKAGGASNFHRGIIFALDDLRQFVSHLNHVFNTYPISSYGTNIEYNVQGTFTADQLSNYVLDKINLPNQANKTQPVLTAYDSGINANQVQWNASANLQNLTGTFVNGGGFSATMTGWQIEIHNVLADGTKNFQALVDLGTKLPTEIIYQTIGNEPTKQFTARLIAKSANSNPDGVSAFEPCDIS